jgi:hypothetical protein
MISRRHFFGIAIATVCGGTVVAAQEKTATVTLVIDGMT